MAQYSFIPSDHPLTVKQWEQKLATEYLMNLFIMKFAGGSEMNIVHVKEELTGKPGDTITFDIRSELIGGTIEGPGVMDGNEGHIEYYDDNVVVNIQRHAVKKKDVKISDQLAAFRLMDDARPAIAEKARRKLEQDCVTALTTIGSERVRGRYLYGNNEANWNATHTTALANLNAVNDQATVRTAKLCKLKARVPRNAYARIRPHQVVMGPKLGIQEWYVYMMHPYSADAMTEHDASWKNAELNIPPTANAQSPIFTGSSFKGARNGILFYEWEYIPVIQSGIAVAHNLFLGAQAMTLAWAQQPTFGFEDQDLGHIKIMEAWEIRGQKKVVWNRAGQNATLVNEDNGIINSFVSAEAPTV